MNYKKIIGSNYYLLLTFIKITCLRTTQSPNTLIRLFEAELDKIDFFIWFFHHHFYICIVLIDTTTSVSIWSIKNEVRDLAQRPSGNRSDFWKKVPHPDPILGKYKPNFLTHVYLITFFSTQHCASNSFVQDFNIHA